MGRAVVVVVAVVVGVFAAVTFQRMSDDALTLVMGLFIACLLMAIPTIVALMVMGRALQGRSTSSDVNSVPSPGVVVIAPPQWNPTASAGSISLPASQEPVPPVRRRAVRILGETVE